jgi:LacI family transcriptional regulator
MPRKKRASRSVTILDVAKHAEVSPMTASRVMNNNPRVGENMRKRVLAAAQHLDYRPNLAGRSLRTSRSTRIGILYSNPSAAYLNQLMIGVLGESSQRGIQVQVETCAGIRSQRAALRRLLDAGVDGVILPPPLCDSRQTLRQMDAVSMPVVAVATGDPAIGITSVRIDDDHGTRAMVRHLLQLGHERIGFIKGDPMHTSAQRREKAFINAMQCAGIDVPPEYIVDGNFNYRSGLIAARQLLELKNRPTAIFSSNDDMAAAALAVAHGMGLHVTDDLTITGFDDTPVASTVWPALTTIHQPVTAMGKAAVRLLIEDIRRKGEGRPGKGSHQVMKYTLVKRESSARPASD